MGALKTCTKCGAEHSATNEHFYTNGPRHDRGGKRYLRPYCKRCDIQREAQRQAREPERMRAINRRASIKYKYGITLEQRDAMLVAQGNKCALCFRALNAFHIGEAHVDHCHKTGKVRGVLCHTCNKALGYFREDTALMQRAIEYLKQGVAADTFQTLGRTQ